MLLALKPEKIKKLLDTYDKEVIEIKASCLRLAWYMRGSVSYTDVLNMSSMEREEINKIVEKNLETTKSSGIPFV
jgi:hypothetical protein